MCRLAGYVSTGSGSLAQMLGTAADRFRDLGERNADGWGVAYRTSDDPQPRVIRECGPIHTSPAFATFASGTLVRHAIVHMRDATPGLPVALRNTHPFIADGLAFAHNGTIDVRRLDELLPPGTVLSGDTDSERYFALLLGHIRDGASGAEAIRAAATAILASGVPYTSLNAVLLTATELVALCQFDPSARPGAADLFDLRLDVRAGIAGVVSSGWDGAPATTLANGTLVRIELGDATPRIQHLL
jgi:predicted glutamine amidotransferase